VQPLAVHLRVDDLDAALALYGPVVGLEVVERDDQRAALGAPGGPPLVHLSSEGVRGPAPARAAGLFHTAIRFPSRPDLAAALRRVAGTRTALTGASDHGVSEALYLDDPAGNGIELYWDRPREVWPPDLFTAPLDLRDLVAAGGDAAAAPPGTDVGHVHLRVGDLERSVAFYVGELGFEVMHRYGAQAAFIANDGYHHDLGLNTWHSLGAPLGPPVRAGLERVVLRARPGLARGDRMDPDGIALTIA
jgi:catechol 2,3-dioxygenase